MPIRIQRTKLFRDTPPGSAYVGRGSRWANPFLSSRFGHARAVGLHRAWLAGRLSRRILGRLGFNDYEIAALERLRRRTLRSLDLLRGRDLICWCNRTSRYCHADILLALANITDLECAA